MFIETSNGPICGFASVTMWLNKLILHIILGGFFFNAEEASSFRVWSLGLNPLDVNHSEADIDFMGTDFT
jgi:hypothetical protein